MESVKQTRRRKIARGNTQEEERKSAKETKRRKRARDSERFGH